MPKELCNKLYNKFVDKLHVDLNENPKFLHDNVMKDIRCSFEIYKSSIDNIDKLDFYDDKEEKYITINFADYYKKAINTIDYENLKLTCEKYKNDPEETQDKAINQHLFYICSTIFNDYTYEMKQKDNGIIHVVNSRKKNLQNDVLINKSSQYIYLLHKDFEEFKEEQHKELELVKKEIEYLALITGYLFIGLLFVYAIS